jgi:hypothetical protein
VKGILEPVKEKHSIFLGEYSEKAAVASLNADVFGISIGISDLYCRILIPPVVFDKLPDNTLEAFVYVAWILVCINVRGHPTQKRRLVEEGLHDGILITGVATIFNSSTLLVNPVVAYLWPAEVHL